MCDCRDEKCGGQASAFARQFIVLWRFSRKKENVFSFYSELPKDCQNPSNNDGTRRQISNACVLYRIHRGAQDDERRISRDLKHVQVRGKKISARSDGDRNGGLIEWRCY